MAKKDNIAESVEEPKLKKTPVELTSKDDQTETVEEQKPKETTVEFLSSLAAVLVTGLFIITFVMQAFEIPSSSMENTLLIGDHVFVNRIQFAPKSSWVGPLLPYRDIRRGDIVVFLHPDPAEAGMYVVKRIMGIPGDHIHLRNGVVFRNGEELKDEPYVNYSADFVPNAYRDNFPAEPNVNLEPQGIWMLQHHVQHGEVVVPPGNYFLLGDNRDASLDSRYWGFVTKEDFVGRPVLVVGKGNSALLHYPLGN